jgi:hypothetical protein
MEIQKIKIISLALAPLLCLFLLDQTAAQVAKLHPVDQGTEDASFRAFRDRLARAVKDRDARFVIGILDPKITLGFDGSEGVAEFKKTWKLDRPDSEIWEVLSEILSRGGSFDSGKRTSFSAPYVYSNWPDDIDSYSHLAITGEDVLVRREPGLDATAIAALSYDIVELARSDEPHPQKDGHVWVRIKLKNGRSGYVSQKFIRSPIDYRAGFEKIRGKWRMAFLVAGD